MQGHGIYSAGVIGARENDRGIVGVCPDSGQKAGGLIVAMVLGDQGTGSGTSIAGG